MPQVYHYGELDSTQTQAQHLLQLTPAHQLAAQPVGTVFHVCATHQFSGRGRHTRTWIDIPNSSSLTTTVIKLPISQLPQAPWLSIIAAFSAVISLSNEAPTLRNKLALKWPNDILLGGRKLGGILTTVLTSSEQLHTYIGVGVGINFTQSQAQLPTEQATSLTLHNADEIPVENYQTQFFETLETRVNQWIAEGFRTENLRQTYEQLLIGLGKTVTVTHFQPENAPAQTYLNAEQILEVAVKAAVSAIHPGYGFLSKNAEFAALVKDKGISWVRPVSSKNA